MSNFMNTRPVGAELFRADGQTDAKNLLVAFRKLAKTPKSNKGLIKSEFLFTRQKGGQATIKNVTVRLYQLTGIS